MKYMKTFENYSNTKERNYLNGLIYDKYDNDYIYNAELYNYGNNLELNINIEDDNGSSIGSLDIYGTIKNGYIPIRSVEVSSKHRKKGLYREMLRELLYVVSEHNINLIGFLSEKNPIKGNTRTVLADEFWEKMIINKDKNGFNIERKDSDYYISLNDI